MAKVAGSMVVLIFLVLADMPISEAAPAPFPRPTRQSPTEEQLIRELRAQGFEVRRLSRAGENAWDVAVSVYLDVSNDVRLGEASYQVQSPGSDRRAALKVFLKLVNLGAFNEWKAGIPSGIPPSGWRGERR
jgi:hypothetical protein